jgi:hypothetical protein
VDWGAAVFWGWFPTRLPQDHMVFSLNLHTIISWEIDFSNYVKKVVEFGKKPEGILGISCFE